jgi:hypothetical protein
MLAEPEEVQIGPLRLKLRPLSMRELRRQFWPLAARLPFFDAALGTDGPGVDFEALAVQVRQTVGEDTPVSASLLARQWALMQQDSEVVWQLSELVALMLVDEGTGPMWPRPDPGAEPGEEANEEIRAAWLESLNAPAPHGRRWLDDALDELSAFEWCDLLRMLIEVNAGYTRTAAPFERAATG